MCRTCDRLTFQRTLKNGLDPTVVTLLSLLFLLPIPPVADGPVVLGGGTACTTMGDCWEDGADDKTAVDPVGATMPPTDPGVATCARDCGKVEDDDTDAIAASIRSFCWSFQFSPRQIGYRDRSGSSSGLPADRIRFPFTFCLVILRVKKFLPRKNFSW